MPQPEHNLIGKTLANRYEVIEIIGRGGQGSVYRAFDKNIQTEIALKVFRLLPSDENSEHSLQRFKREVKVVSQFRHSHILNLSDYGEEGDLYFFAMPLMETGTLKAYLQNAPLPLDETLRLIEQIADALDYAHAQNVIHRDIKPDNVLFDGSSRKNVLLTDFGLARLMTQPSDLSLSGGIVGTLAYIAPEQIQENADHRSDIYAVAVILYEMLVGEVPFKSNELVKLIQMHLHEAPPPPMNKNPDIPFEVEEVILKGLEKDPDSRYQSAGELAQALKEAIRSASQVNYTFPDWEESVDETETSDNTEDTAYHYLHRRDFYRQQQLPPHYVPRTDLYETIVDLLLSEQRPFALHGMGGIGKTTIARALCDDQAIQDKFANGILWATLGQEPDFVPQLRAWITELGGMIEQKAPSLDQLKSSLAEALKDRKCLLILDDVWETEHAQNFNVLPEQNQLFITTRNARIAHDLGAFIHPMETMEEAEAIDLLDKWAGDGLADAEYAQKAQIVNQLGRLPLAMKLAGGRLRDLTVDEWSVEYQQAFELRDLDAEWDADRAEDSVFVCLQISINDLRERVQKMYFALGIFPEDEAIPEVAIARLWEQVGRLRSKETTRVLSDLANRALITVHGGEQRSYNLHDLLRQYIREQLGSDTENTHEAMLAAYRATQTGDGWHTAPDDGYLYDHLVYHLEAIDDYAQIRVLFANHDWMHARVQSDNWLYDSYLSDLDAYWRYAERRTVEEINAGSPPDTLAECVRCVSIQSSINSISQSYSPEDIALAYKFEIWSTERTLDVISRIPPSLVEPRPEYFLRLLTTCREQPLILEMLRTEILKGIFDETINDIYMGILAPRVPSETLAEIWNVLNERKFEGLNKDIILLIAINLPNDFRTISVKQTIDLLFHNSPFRLGLGLGRPGSPRHDLINVLAKIFPNLKESYVDHSKISEILGGLTSYLSEAEQQILLNKIQVNAIKNGKIQLLVTVAQHLPEEKRLEVIDTALQLALDKYKSPRNERYIRTWGKYYHHDTLSLVLPYLSDDERINVVQTALQIARDFININQRLESSIEIIPFMSDPEKDIVLDEAFEITNIIADSDERIELLIKLLPLLPEFRRHIILDEYLQLTRTYADPLHRITHILKLLPLLPEKRHEGIIDEIFSLESDVDDHSQMDAFVYELFPYLQGKHYQKKGDLLSQVLNRPPEFGDGFNIAGTLLGLAWCLPEDQQLNVINEALVQFDVDSDIMDKGLKILITYLSKTDLRPPVLINKALKFSGKHNDSSSLPIQYTHAWNLISIVPYLRNEQAQSVLNEALQLARNIDMSEDKMYVASLQRFSAEILTKIAEHLPESQNTTVFDEALQIARTDENVNERYKNLSFILSNLPELKQQSLVDEVIQLAWQIDDPKFRVRSLTREVRYLPAGQLKSTINEIVALAREIGNEFVFNETLIRLIPFLPDNKRHQVIVKCLDYTFRLKDEYKTHFLIGLAPCLIGRHMLRAVRCASTLPDIDHVRILLEFAEHFPEPNKSHILSKALQITINNMDEYNFAKVVRDLAPYLPFDLLEQAWNAIHKKASLHDRADLLATLFPLLEVQKPEFKSQIHEYLLTTLSELRSDSRQDVLNFINTESLFSPTILSIEFLSQIADDIIDICNHWEWV
ncbi:MAG: protein kinase [Aggregatilineales bacterium]